MLRICWQLVDSTAKGFICGAQASPPPGPDGARFVKEFRSFYTEFLCDEFLYDEFLYDMNSYTIDNGAATTYNSLSCLDLLVSTFQGFDWPCSLVPCA